ncbi:hypothetical protein [uncultured Winogradskyella sp.]|uniref:hypothetical protein n=1 Tax=uncultured Winogradskyella sp. TaxID=395353 RepID=UPI0030D6EB99|tara:strand:+ start:4928 stop:5245 length:318 start_codon:yes stop_codon:yes gene_type:complete
MVITETISIKTICHPDIIVLFNTNLDNINFISDISIIPTCGIRRNVGNHFTYETGIGVGYVHYFEEETIIINDASGAAINLHLRIGYRFLILFLEIIKPQLKIIL